MDGIQNVLQRLYVILKESFVQSATRWVQYYQEISKNPEKSSTASSISTTAMPMFE